MYKERYTFEEKQVTNLDLQIYNCQVAMLELSYYELLPLSTGVYWARVSNRYTARQYSITSNTVPYT